MTRGVGLVNLERSEPLEILQKVIAQLGITIPILAQDALGNLLHCNNGHWNERYAEKQYNGRRQANGNNNSKQRKRRCHRIEELRKILPKVGLKLLTALYRKLYNLGRRNMLRIARAQHEQLFIDTTAQCALNIL